MTDPSAGTTPGRGAAATHRYTVPVRPGRDRGLLAARLWAAGAIGVWERPGQTVAWFRAPSGTVPPGGDWTVEPDVDWHARWRASVRTVRAGPFVIVPSWRADEHDPRPGETTIVLDPGRAFGSGHHATTAMCLGHLAEVALDGARVLDVGTGSGILAVAAALRGAGGVVAVDRDADAVAAAADNARRAGAAIDLRRGGMDAVADEPPFDVVLANLLTATLEQLAEPLAATVAPGGVLIASGIAAGHRDRAVAALARAGLGAPVAVTTDEGWVAVRWG